VDRLGTVWARTDTTGKVTARFEYLPWGESWSSPAVPGDLQYNGRLVDAGTGFYDYGARMYFPSIGRLISADTIGRFINAERAEEDRANPQSSNQYAYVFDNPYRYTDPAGLDPADAGTDAGHWVTFRVTIDNDYHPAQHVDESASVMKPMVAQGLAAGAIASEGYAAANKLAAAANQTAKAARAAAAANTAGGASEHIVLGLRDYGLRETAAKVGGRHLLDDPNWMETLKAAIRNPDARFTVSLEGFGGETTYAKIMGAAQRGGTSAAKYTEWEIAQLHQAGRLHDVTFVNRAAEVIANPF